MKRRLVCGEKQMIREVEKRPGNDSEEVLKGKSSERKKKKDPGPNPQRPGGRPQGLFCRPTSHTALHTVDIQ